MKEVERTFDTSAEYKKYIASNAWRARRVRYFDTYGKSCKGCGDTPRQIHVHHKTYERFGNEELTDLVSLCQACHTAVHDRHHLGDLSLLEATDLVLGLLRSRPRRKLEDPVVTPWKRGPRTLSPRKGKRLREAGVLGRRRPATSPRSWSDRNAEYVRLREREEARRRTA